MRREFRKADTRTCRDTEEIHEDAVIEPGVLIHQDSYCFVLLERLKNGTREIFLANQMIARRRTPALHQRVDASIVERPNYDVHRRRHQRMREGADLPVAQMRRGEQHSPALLQ